MTAVSILPIILLLLLAVLIGLIITAFVKGGATTRWILGAFVGFILLGFLGLFTLRQSRPVSERIFLYSDSDSFAQSVTVDVVKDPLLWQRNLEEELTPTVYSSLKAAACGMGIQLQQTIDTAAGQRAETVLIIENDSNVDIIYLEELRRGLTIGLPDADIAIVHTAPESSPPPGVHWVTLTKQQEQSSPVYIYTQSFEADMAIHRPHAFEAGNTTGTLKAVVQTDRSKYARQVEYDHRPWLWEPDKFRPAVHLGHFVVIASDKTTVSQQQAQQQVLQAARHYLAERIALPAEHISQRDLHNHRFIVDEYTQCLQGVAGPIWRAAVLLDISHRRLGALQHTGIAAQRQVMSTWLYKVLSLAGMMALVSLLYASVNALTKGYYSFLLALMSIVVIAGFLIVILLLM